MNDDYDVIEMDLPDYQEEHSAIPDVEDEISFAENKEEIYRRNRLIAAEEQAKQLREAEREKLLRRERNEELIRVTESAETYVIPKKAAVSVVIVFCIVLFSVIALVNNNSKAGVEYAYDEIVAETTVMRETAVTEKVTRVTTERKKRETTTVTEKSEAAAETTEAPIEATTEVPAETTAEIPPEVLKTMIVREPFADDGNSYIYNTAVMSYRFTAENGGINEYGIKKITIYVSVKNLTDYGYLVIPYYRSFRLTDSSSGNYQDCDLADYDREHTHFSSSFKYEGDEEWREGSPVAFSFDENSLCEFSLDIYFDTESDIEYDTFEYDPQNGFPRYYENADVGFEIPLSEILKYAK